VTVKFRVRPARAEDALEIVSWFPDHDAAVMWGGPHVPDPIEAPWLAREFRSRSRAHFVLADEADRPLALIGMRRRLSESRVHLIRVGVRPEARGRGLAGRLIEAVAQIARAGGAGRLTLNVYGANSAAVRAYEKAGFAVAGATHGLPGSVRMVRRL
jgi:RimJ/RimL family protein N-acetyltransferase